MNRDESLDRPKACGPEIFRRDGLHVIHPFEPQGGTWISSNSRGSAFALLNWYSVADKISIKSPRSRGFLTKDVSSTCSPQDAESRLHLDKLQQTLPFRLFGFFLDSSSVVEWRWNGYVLENIDHPWRQNMWVSSGFNEPSAQAIRQHTLNEFIHPSHLSNQDWLRALHASHIPQKGPFSICMHRSDAQTVSYTEIETSASETSVRYFPGPLCEKPKPVYKEIPASLASDSPRFLV
ncbi:MAG: NRDE family protein [Verrucomicrobia bacterium]|nr:NRDE family protein [Verrucomicrobiota bacterium]